MNDADIDLIISLANDELVGEERAAALARINDDPSLARELATQVSMIDAVQPLSGAEMNSSERAAMRTNLVEQLHLEETSAALVPVKRATSWWRPAVIGLASVTAVVFAIVVVPNMLSSRSSDDVALVELSTEPSQEFSASSDSADTTSAPSESDGASIEDAGAGAAPSIADVALSDGPVLYRVPDDRQDEFNDLAFGETAESLLTEKLAASGFTRGTVLDTVSLSECLEELEDSLPLGESVAIAYGDGGSVYVGFDAGEGITSIVEISVVPCNFIAPIP